MKSISDTLTLVTGIVGKVRKTVPVDVALVGGYAVISHGVGRTTMDVDFLFYSEELQKPGSRFIQLFIDVIPPQFETKWVEGSRMVGDPFPYDILFLKDKSGEYPRMDFIVPRYKWELEGLKNALPLKDFSFPVLSIPYLIAMKLRAGSHRDHSDILELYNLLNQENKEKTHQLAKLVKRDKNLTIILEFSKSKTQEPEDNEMLLHC